MGIGIAAEKSNLEKQHTGRPNCRTAPIPREDISGDDWLNLKQEKGAQKNCGNVEWHNGVLEICWFSGSEVTPFNKLGFTLFKAAMLAGCKIESLIGELSKM